MGILWLEWGSKGYLKCFCKVLCRDSTQFVFCNPKQTSTCSVKELKTSKQVTAFMNFR